MKLLFLEWNSMGKSYIKSALQKAGFVLVSMNFPKEKEDVRCSEVLIHRIVDEIVKHQCSLVFSSNYYPVAAMACKVCGVKYISWCYDSPLMNLYSNTVFYESNYIFHFDRAECEKLRSKGVKNIFYLPLAAPVDLYDTYTSEGLSREQRERYRADICFVGSMYSEENMRLYKYLDNLDEYSRGYLEGLADSQRAVYGYNFLEQSIPKDIIEKVCRVAPIAPEGDGFETAEWMCANYMLARKIATDERTEALSVLSEIADVKLFTHEATPQLPRVRNMGKLGYHSETPYAFRSAKICLNISLRSIQTGIPLRAFDIMGSGGFLLTNYQEDFLEYFTPDEDFVYYESIKDLKEKAEFYLTHDAERIEIAEKGYAKVKQQHSFEHRLLEIMRTVLQGA